MRSGMMSWQEKCQVGQRSEVTVCWHVQMADCCEFCWICWKEVGPG